MSHLPEKREYFLSPESYLFLNLITLCKMYKYAEVEARAQALSFSGSYFNNWAKESWSDRRSLLKLVFFQGGR